MRADRLIALLLLLQQRGRVTAAEVAEALEVSERTARRDLDALAISGVPLYSMPGRGGGWQLVGGARTDLTGLSADEARALFVAAGPSLAATPELRSAMAKLTSALPGPFRAGATTAAAAIRVDPAGWGRDRPAEPAAMLDPLVRAVVDGRQVEIDYDSARRTKGRRVVHPLGLVAKRATWYLLAIPERPEGRPGPNAREAAEPQPDHGGAGDSDDPHAAVQTYRVDRIRSLTPSDAIAIRPAGFDLDRAWGVISARIEALRAGIEVTAWIRTDMFGPIRWQFGAQCSPLDEPPGPPPTTDDQWVAVRLTEGGVGSMAAMLAGFGAAVRLVEPPEALVAEIARIGRELSDLYPAPHPLPADRNAENPSGG